MRECGTRRRGTSRTRIPGTSRTRTPGTTPPTPTRTRGPLRTRTRGTTPRTRPRRSRRSGTTRRPASAGAPSSARSASCWSPAASIVLLFVVYELFVTDLLNGQRQNDLDQQVHQQWAGRRRPRRPRAAGARRRLRRPAHPAAGRGLPASRPRGHQPRGAQGRGPGTTPDSASPVRSATSRSPVTATTYGSPFRDLDPCGRAIRSWSRRGQLVRLPGARRPRDRRLRHRSSGIRAWRS